MGDTEVDKLFPSSPTSLTHELLSSSSSLSSWYEIKDPETRHTFFVNTSTKNSSTTSFTTIDEENGQKKDKKETDNEEEDRTIPACAETRWTPSIDAIDTILRNFHERNQDLNGRLSMASRSSGYSSIRKTLSGIDGKIESGLLKNNISSNSLNGLTDNLGLEISSDKENSILNSPVTSPRRNDSITFTVDQSADKQWRVKIHTDSGQVYYANDTLNTLSWENPFTDNVLLKQLGEEESLAYDGAEKIDEDEMIGYNDVPDRSTDLIKATPAAISAKASLLSWMEEESIKVTQEDSIALQWPEYIESEKNFKEFDNVPVHVLLPTQAIFRKSNKDTKEEEESTLIITISSSDTVENLLEKVFLKYEVESGNILDEIDMLDYYIFKNTGTEEYMYHRNYRLGLYPNVITAWRKCAPLKLQLMKLNHAEQLDITTIFTLDAKKEEQKLKRQVHQEDTYNDFLQWYKQQYFTEDYDLEPEKHWQQMQFITTDDLRWPLRACILGIEKFPLKDVLSKDFDTIFIEIGLYYNGDFLSAPTAGRSSQLQSLAVNTTKLLACEEPVWPQQWLNVSNVNLCSMPPQTRIGIRVMGLCELGEKKSKEAIPLAGVVITAFDYTNSLIQGKHKLRLWPSKELQLIRDPKLGKHDNPPPRTLSMTHSPVGDNIENNSGILHIQFDTYELPIKAAPASLKGTFDEVSRLKKNKKNNKKLTVAEIAEETKQESMAVSQVDVEDRAHIEKGHSLKELQLSEKKLMWRSREIAKERPALLPKFLQSMNSTDSDHILISRKLITKWKRQPSGREANYLELLDIQYQDPVIREYALWLIASMEDSEFKEYVLQLVQVLKYEPYHDSPLARLLIKRAIENPLEIGHRLYWNLKAEMYNPDIAERYGVLLSVYLQNAGLHRVLLWRQLEVNTALQDIAKKIKEKSKDRRIPYIKEEIEKLNKRYDKLLLCLNPKLSLKSIVPEKCKVMSSKKLPLWLVFENSDPHGERYMALFKEGDDLRQDMMTLQMLRIMDKIWLQNKLDLKMNPYDCVSTGDGLGMIEAVKSSVTTAYIQQVYGGKIAGAFLKAPIDNFLREFNRTEELYATSVGNFVHTCAGYCVATYVLGIGDRHADNIMVTQAGHLFHIDFGHFLGNFKKKFGINRERTAFVFTPEMHYVMIREDKIRPDFEDFQSECCTAYNLLRQNANLFINLFKLMVPAAMPELMEADDINYMVDQLDLEFADNQANIKFVGEIQKSLDNTFRRFDNWIHNLKHG